MTATVALFGGSFNPPHVAHQMVCLFVLETCDVDEVWVIPTYRHPFAKDLEDFDHRYRMCQLACRCLGDRVRVTDIEKQLGQPSSRTLDTLQALARQHPGVGFRLVIGADILSETDKWYRWDEVSAMAPPIVVGRAGWTEPSGAGAPTPPRRGEQHFEVELPRVSSTEVRARISRGESAVPLVPRSVMDYIAERGLYR